MDQIISDYLILIYIIPTVSILWAASDIKFFISVVKVGAVMIILYGGYESFNLVDKASRYVSYEDKLKMFFGALSPFFIFSSGILLHMVCLKSVLEHRTNTQDSP